MRQAGVVTLLSVAHRTPADAAGVAALAGCGADVFEIDLRLLADDLVVTHFLPVVSAVPLLQHDGWRFRLGRRDPVAPLLAAAVVHLPPTAMVLLDLKDDRGSAAHRLADRLLDGGLAELPVDPARLHVSSHSWAVLERLERAGWQTWRTIGSPRRLAAFDAVGPGGAWAVTVRHRLLTDAVLERWAGSTRLTAWTVNDVRRAQELLDGGVLGITTDSCDVHRVVAAARG